MFGRHYVPIGNHAFVASDDPESRLDFLVGTGGVERRVMLEHQGRPVRCRIQLPVEPVEPVGAKLAVRRARHVGVEHNQPQRIAFDDVLQKTLGRQIAVGGEFLAQQFPIVVIAGQQIDRDFERRQQIAQAMCTTRPMPMFCSPMSSSTPTASESEGRGVMRRRRA